MNYWVWNAQMNVNIDSQCKMYFHAMQPCRANNQNIELPITFFINLYYLSIINIDNLNIFTYVTITIYIWCTF